MCLLFTVLLIQPVADCNKNSTKADNKVHGLQTLPGAWEFRLGYGGYSATGGGTAAPGNGNIKRFTDNAYWVAYEYVVKDSATYTLAKGINPETNIEADAMVLNGDTNSPVFFHIADDTLTIYHGVTAAGGTVKKYVRIYTPEDLIKMDN